MGGLRGGLWFKRDLEGYLGNLGIWSIYGHHLTFKGFLEFLWHGILANWFHYIRDMTSSG